MRVNNVKTFKISEKLEMYVIKGQPEEGNYKTVVADVDANYLTVALPIHRGRYVHLKPGTRILIVQIKADAIYMYEYLIEDVKTEGIKVFTVTQPQKVKRVQRRDYFRVTYPFNIDLIRAEKTHNPNQKIVIEQYRTDNLSGGGLAFYSTEGRHDIQDRFFVKLRMDECQYIFKGHVVRKQKDLDRELVAIKIDEIDKRDREKIIRSLFIKQKELLQKGIL